MNSVSPYHKILFQYEVLRSRLEIREYLLNTIVQDVYENIGQSLSLVRIYLVSLNSSDADIKIASNIVGKSIKDLKDMCRLFDRYIELDNDAGWIKMLDYTIQKLNMNPCEPIRIDGEPISMSMGLKLIIARMVQEILISLNHKGKKFINAHIVFSRTTIKILIDFSGGLLRFNDINCRGALDTSQDCLNFTEKAKLIKADISTQIIEKDLNRFIIKVSLTSPFNE